VVRKQRGGRRHRLHDSDRQSKLPRQHLLGAVARRRRPDDAIHHLSCCARRHSPQLVSDVPRVAPATRLAMSRPRPRRSRGLPLPLPTRSTSAAVHLRTLTELGPKYRPLNGPRDAIQTVASYDLAGLPLIACAADSGVGLADSELTVPVFSAVHRAAEAGTSPTPLGGCGLLRELHERRGPATSEPRAFYR